MTTGWLVVNGWTAVQVADCAARRARATMVAMDSRGHMYAGDDRLAAKLQEVSPTKIRPLVIQRKKMIGIDDPGVASALAGMHRASRMVFYGARKNGDSERIAFAKAQARARGASR